MSNLYFNNVEKVGQLYLEYVFFEFESEQYYLYATIN